LANVSGVFSRYFIVGFFAPTFFALVAVDLAGSKELLPKTMEAQDSRTFLVLGTTALLVGLLLLGLNFPVIRIFEGYFLMEPDAGTLRRHAAKFLRDRQKTVYDRHAKDEASADPLRRTLASWRLDTRFPEERADVLPTRLGNVVRAFELYSKTRWGLSAIAAWPRIEVLLGDQERQLHADTQGEFAFFLNGALASFLVAIALAIDGAVNHPHPLWLDWLYALPPVAGYLLYRGAVNSAERWGERVRASVDIHRLELYTQLGLRAPRTSEEEREIAAAVSNLFFWGVPIPDSYRAQPAPPSSGSFGGSPSGQPGSRGSGGGTSGQPGSGA
jgi:hypothetical protein